MRSRTRLPTWTACRRHSRTVSTTDRRTAASKRKSESGSRSGRRNGRAERARPLRKTGDLPEHLVPQRQDEREAVIALHPADGDAHEIPFLIEHAAARHARMTVGQAGDEAVGRPLPYVSAADDDAL